MRSAIKSIRQTALVRSWEGNIAYRQHHLACAVVHLAILSGGIREHVPVNRDEEKGEKGRRAEMAEEEKRNGKWKKIGSVRGGRGWN
jgi:hypothetical protein